MAAPKYADIKVFGNIRTNAAKVEEVVAQEDTIDLCVMLHVIWIWSSIPKAVVRIDLMPLIIKWVSVIDIVTERLLFTPCQIWLFALESLIRPIVIEGQDFRHSHRIDELTCPTLRLASRTHNPISDPCALAYLDHASSQGANPEKWVRRKTVIAADDVGE